MHITREYQPVHAISELTGTPSSGTFTGIMYHSSSSWWGGEQCQTQNFKLLKSLQSSHGRTSYHVPGEGNGTYIHVE